MDTKLKNNDNEEVEIKEIRHGIIERRRRYKGIDPKTKLNRPLYLLFILLLSLTLIVCKLNIKNRYYYSSIEDNIRDDYYVQNQLVRYAKNVNRYHLFYGGDGFGKNPYASDKEIIDYKQMLLSKLYEEELVLNNEYSEMLRDTYSIRSDRAPITDEVEYSMNENTFIFEINNRIYEEKEMKLQEIRNKYNLTDGQISEIIIQEKRANYMEIKSYLETTTDFAYYITDASTGSSYTSLPENEDKTVQEFLNNNKYYMGFSIQDYPFTNKYFNNELISESFADNFYSGYIVIRGDEFSSPEVNIGNRIAMLEYEYSRYYSNRSIYNIVFFNSLLITLLLSVYCLLNKKRRSELVITNAWCLNHFQRTPLIVKVIGGFVSFVLIILSLDSPFGWISMSLWGIVSLIIIMPMVAYMILLLQYIINLFRYGIKIEDEPELRFIRRSLHNLGSYIRYLSESSNILLLLLLIILFVGIIFTSGCILLFVIFGVIPNFYGEYILMTIGLLILLSFLVILARAIMVYGEICYITANMHSERIKEVQKEKGMFSKPINALLNINKDLTKNIREMMKNERLKTELITNVSHDLKTPLTSIINYVDLLKELPLQSKEAESYLEVLDKKSTRLKILIEDLFEASKLNTGDIQLEIDRINIVDLLKQTIGELKIDESDIILKSSFSSDYVWIDVDGKKMWRVFENLLGNIIKYSARGSRAYISIIEDENKVILVLKNISSNELNMEAEELFERSKRGDASRAEEGSGLGLSIARSIIELHDGNIMIDLDGDLFKVTVSLPKNAA